MSGTRRDFVRQFGLILGAPLVYGEFFPEGLLPIGLEGDPLAGKHKELIQLSDRPWNIETPAHLLDDLITPADKMFVRNNGTVPEGLDANNWTLLIDGESVPTPKTYTLAELKRKFKSYTYRLTIECAGNGRSEFDPPASGNQWKVGAVSCAAWTGVRLKDILADVGYSSNAVYIGYYGKDKHLSGDPDKIPISRGVPMRKALEDETLVAWAMNGEDIPLMHGYPLRLVIGGWPASVSGKWLYRIALRNKEHDGPKMTGHAYRMPCNPVAPGEKVDEKDMCIIESMPVKSLITYPKSGGILKLGSTLSIRGKAWAGDNPVKSVEVSSNFGASWQPAQLETPHNRLAWQPFNAKLRLPKVGYYEIWARATDNLGNTQPMVVPGWNPEGYLNNACHRIAIRVNA